MSRYMKILRYSVFYIGCLNFINSCCFSKGSEEKKLSKEYIAKALGVTEDKIWAFDIYSAGDDAKHMVKNGKYGGLKTPKILVDNMNDARYSSSCFVLLCYINTKDVNKCKVCVALVSDKNSIKVNNDMLIDKKMDGKQEKEVVSMSIIMDCAKYYTKILVEANNKRVSLEDDKAVERLTVGLLPNFISEGLFKVYICK